MSENDPSVPTLEQRRHWRKMEQLERAVENMEIWRHKLAVAELEFKRWKTRVTKLEKELGTEAPT